MPIWGSISSGFERAASAVSWMVRQGWLRVVNALCLKVCGGWQGLLRGQAGSVSEPGQLLVTLRSQVINS